MSRFFRIGSYSKRKRLLDAAVSFAVKSLAGKNKIGLLTLFIVAYSVVSHSKFYGTRK